MSTAFKSISSALVSALAAAPALADGRIWSNRLRPLPAGSATAVVVRQANSRGDEVVLGALDWATSFAIECYGRGPAGADPADAVDQLLKDVWARLSAVDPGALGAMAVAVAPGVEWQFDEGEAPMACAIAHLIVQHRTPMAALDAWP